MKNTYFMSGPYKQSEDNPCFSFYPKEWTSSPSFNLISYEAKGLFIELLCIMGLCKPRGTTISHGRNFDNNDIARLTRIPIDKLKSLIGELAYFKLIFVSSDGVIRANKKFVRYESLTRTQISDRKNIFKQLLQDYDNSCAYCGAESDLAIDHIIPVSKGGSNEYGNLQILCRRCNSKKGVKKYVNKGT